MGKTNLHCLHACLNGTQTCDCERPFRCVSISRGEKDSEQRKRWMENINRIIGKEKVLTRKIFEIRDLAYALDTDPLSGEYNF